MNSDWARSLAGRKKRELEERRFQQEKDLSDRNLLNAHAAPMWAQVHESCRELVRQLNEEMGREHVSFRGMPGATSCEFQIGTSRYQIEFHAPSWVLSVHGNIYKLMVIEGSGVVWTKDERVGNSRFTSEQVAQNEVSRIFMLP